MAFGLGHVASTWYRYGRAIFRGRELLMGAERSVGVEPRALLPWVLDLGWGVLAVEPRQIRP